MRRSSGTEQQGAVFQAGLEDIGAGKVCGGRGGRGEAHRGAGARVGHLPAPRHRLVRAHDLHGQQDRPHFTVGSIS